MVATMNRCFRFSPKFCFFSLILYGIFVATVITGKVDEDDEDMIVMSNADPMDTMRSASEDLSDKTFYSFTVKDIKGNQVSLEKYKGMVSLVVNVASECGYTDGHYKALVRLYNKLKRTKKFTILAFPCNQFGAQEPGNNLYIERFAKNYYKVKFPMFSKINVVDDRVPEAWKYLIKAAAVSPNWNFFKYLVDHDGHVLATWGPWVNVEDVEAQILDAVEDAGANVDEFRSAAKPQEHTEL